MNVRIFITGGTFDKEYNELDGELFFKCSHLQEMLTLGRCKAAVDVRTLMMVDSASMTDDDRDIIAHNCAKSHHERILVTHGTDTMVDTARVIAERLERDNIENKTIVLTGAMVPYTFGSSDGLFNLGSSLAYARVLSPGVYVVMNGRFFEWDNVAKNKKTGVFEDIH